MGRFITTLENTHPKVLKVIKMIQKKLNKYCFVLANVLLKLSHLVHF